MPYLPIVPGGDNAKSEFVESFGGLCHRERSADGTGTTRKNGALQFYNEKNLSARDFPALATREKRYTVTTGTTGESGVRVCTDIVDDGTTLWRLCWEIGEAYIPRGEQAYMTDGTIWFSLPIQYDGDGFRHRVKRQIIRMGAYLLIWPEKVWINTARRTGAIVGWQTPVYDPSYSEKSVRLFDKDFREIYPMYYNETPESPTVGEYRVMQSSNTTTPTVTVWNGSAWADPGAVYTYLYHASFGVEAGDIVKVNGFYDRAAGYYETGRFAFLNNKQYTVAKVDEDGFYLPVGCYPGIYTYGWTWGITVQKANRAPEVGMMEQRNTASVSVVLCRESGDAYTGVTVSPTAPADPADKALWMDTGGDTPVLKEWSATQEIWVEIPTTYLKISGSGIGQGLSAGDGVFLTGFSDTAYNGSYVLRGAGADYLVVDGIITSAVSGETVTAARTVPEMDFVVESNNRIWGCKYGVVNGQLVNEIYASKLGDFKNWHVFDGLSTDSYAASRGSGGEWTGAIEYGGLPLFFKENSIEKVYPSASGAHRIVSTQARGVQKGCQRSLTIVNEALFYKAVGGVMVYDGSLPTLISEDLGEYQFLYEAAGGGLDGIYYISMQTSYNGWGEWHTFTYDVNKGIWHREDDTSVRQFLPYGGKMYFVSQKGIRDGLYMNVKYDLVSISGGGTEAVDWMAETGPIGYHDSNQKYLSRFLLRMKTEGSVMLYIRYDEGEWLHRGTVQMGGITKTITMPVPPRRCDHVYLRLVGDAEMKLFGMTRYYERGSDMAW